LADGERLAAEDSSRCGEEDEADEKDQREPVGADQGSHKDEQTPGRIQGSS
jgi:hypothetical protein